LLRVFVGAKSLLEEIMKGLLEKVLGLMAAILTTGANKLAGRLSGSTLGQAMAALENEDEDKLFPALEQLVERVRSTLGLSAACDVLEQPMSVLLGVVNTARHAMGTWIPQDLADGPKVTELLAELARCMDVGGTGWLKACSELVLILEPDGHPRQAILSLLGNPIPGPHLPSDGEMESAFEQIQQLTQVTVALSTAVTALKAVLELGLLDQE
jgi:hypothetical protein